MWSPKRKKGGNDGHGGLGLRDLLNSCKKTVEKSRKIKKKPPQILVVQKNISNLLLMLICLACLGVGFMVGTIYASRDSGTVKVVDVGGKALTTEVEPSKPSMASRPTPQSNGLDTLALQTQALKKRVQDMK